MTDVQRSNETIADAFAAIGVSDADQLETEGKLKR